MFAGEMKTESECLAILERDYEQVDGDDTFDLCNACPLNEGEDKDTCVPLKSPLRCLPGKAWRKKHPRYLFLGELKTEEECKAILERDYEIAPANNCRECPFFTKEGGCSARGTKLVCDCEKGYWRKKQPVKQINWRSCFYGEAQQHRRRLLSGSIGLEGQWSKWMDGKPDQVLMQYQYEYRTSEPPQEAGETAIKECVSKSFEDVARPLVKWLNENFHSPVKVIITPTGTDLVEVCVATRERCYTLHIH
jgi:hypothetical protein